MKVRISFSKYGNMIYIGHLDTMRYFQKAFRRAELPIRYTTGFSAHQIMSFAYPLGVGMVGLHEYLDVEMDEGVSSEDIVNRLQKEMVSGFTINDAVKLNDDAMNAMASVKAATYEIKHKEENFAKEINADTVQSFIMQPTIPYTKVTAKNSVEIDLKEHIYSLSFDNGSLMMQVDASSSGNLKPFTVLEELASYNGISIDTLDYQIIRHEVYTIDSDDRFISLLEVGVTF